MTIPSMTLPLREEHIPPSIITDDDPAERDADIAHMAATRTGWYAPAGKEEAEFDAWLETEEGRLWLERQLEIYCTPIDAFEVTDAYL